MYLHNDVLDPIMQQVHYKIHFCSVRFNDFPCMTYTVADDIPHYCIRGVRYTGMSVSLFKKYRYTEKFSVIP